MNHLGYKGSRDLVAAHHIHDVWSLKPISNYKEESWVVFLPTAVDVLPRGVTRGRPNPLHITLPRRIKQAIERADTTAVRLSIEAGFARNLVYYVATEHRIPGIDVVERLARVLGVAPGWLAYGLDVDVSPPGDDLACSAMGERLRELREARGMTQRAIAELAGVTHHAIHSTEVGRTLPSVATAEQLADALDVSPAWLAYGEGPQVIARRRARKRP